MKITHFEGKQVFGISIRTTNAKETNPATAKIGGLYQQFDKQVPVDYQGGARVYGVYYNYESDHTGEFSVLAGADKITSPHADGLEAASLPSGTYAVFEAVGEMPNVVIETWKAIWEYFSRNDAQYQRAYTTDFEFYKGPNQVAVHIAVR